MDIDDAIEATAGAGDREISMFSKLERAVASEQRVKRTRQTIVRFLQNVPDDLTVFELREMLEQAGDR